MKVLVIGATGALGRRVVKTLLERGVPVRAVNRHPEQAADLARLGAEVMAGDLTDPPSLQRACAGVQRVLAAAHGIMGRGRWRSEAVDDAGHRALVDAARASGVQRFLYLSAYGASESHPIDFFRTKHRIEQMVRASGLETVVLRPTAFMEHHVHLFNGKAILEKGKTQLIGAGGKPRNFIAATDVAAFAVRALLEDPPPFAVLDIGGPDHLSNAEVAELYARECGIEPRIGRLPAGVARVISVLAAPLHPGLARIMRLMSLPDDAFSERFDGAQALERDYGVKLTRVRDFVKQQVRLAKAGTTG
jgi:NADH dehydrogenase